MGFGNSRDAWNEIGNRGRGGTVHWCETLDEEGRPAYLIVGEEEAPDAQEQAERSYRRSLFRKELALSIFGLGSLEYNSTFEQVRRSFDRFKKDLQKDQTIQDLVRSNHMIIQFDDDKYLVVVPEKYRGDRWLAGLVFGSENNDRAVGYADAIKINGNAVQVPINQQHGGQVQWKTLNIKGIAFQPKGIRGWFNK